MDAYCYPNGDSYSTGKILCFRKNDRQCYDLLSVREPL